MSRVKPKRTKKYRCKKSEVELLIGNPVIAALADKWVDEGIREAETKAGLHIIMGNDPAAALKLFCEYAFLPLHAMINKPGAWDIPEMNIIAATVRIVDDTPYDAAWLERHRASIKSAYNAAMRLREYCTREELINAHLFLHYVGVNEAAKSLPAVETPQ